ncbi:ABC-type transport auxiliary lipoprotein family protein [Pseudomonas jilinensis]|uniref:ABC-type transport auxiliary lipoprotein component domain-containing protein n=1 Tax=Pseudomonas jilinensis TaxID=2078689 RepID=A0A396S515_9PSED|nr:ABC-type transport auxiliary lipoprotein family protein [Pseudomonas jilinensis]RHW22874.1 hypothetical protein C2846_00230 [Pseudomonas jilinensis]
MIRATTLRPLLAASGLLWLSACTLIPESEPVRVYQLPASTLGSNPQVQPLSLSLRINTPQAGFAQSGPRMLVNPQGDQLSTYKGARWSDPAPALVREHLVRSFSLRSGLESVTSDEHGLHADLHLGSDLQRFQVIYSEQGPQATVELVARLIEPGNRHVIASRTFLVEQPLDDHQPAGAVKAYGLALDQLSSQLLDWALPQLQDYQQHRP